MTPFLAWCVSVYGIYGKYLWIFIVRGQQGVLVSKLSINQLIVVSQWLDYFCSFIDSDLSWRVPLFVQCVIGAILAAGSLVLPESPR